MDKIVAMSVELFERLWENRLIARNLTMDIKSVKFSVKQRSMFFPSFIHEKA